MTNPSMHQHSYRDPRNAGVIHIKSFVLSLASAAVATCLMLGGNFARAQAPTNQLHFAFTDASGTTTPSDTSLNPSAIVTTLTMYNALSPAGAVDLHGPVGSGVTNIGVASLSRAIDYTADIIPTQTNQPANSTLTVVNGSAEAGNNPASGSGNAALAVDLGDAALANLGNAGVIGPFVATIWANLHAPIPAGETVCPRIWILNTGTTGLDTGNAASPGSLGLKWQQNNQVAFSMGTDNPTLLGTLSSGTFPTNTWMYFAVVYDNTNFYIYYGTPAAAPTLIGKSVSSPLSRAYSITTSGTLAIGNRRTSTTYNTRGINGWINDFRFYGGIGNAAFVQSVWASALGNPPVVSSIYPDGQMLQAGTNTLSFTVSSPQGNDITNVSVVLNGVNVSSQLSYVTNGTSGTSSNLSVSYSNLQLNQTNAAVITARDAAGLIGGGAGTFDTFSATNFTWEAEEFDHDSGQFINNPDYTTYATNTGYFGLDSVAGVDTFKVATANSSALDYRAGSNDGMKTQTAPATGEQLRQKFLNNLADGAAVDHAVGFWSSSDWENYTKTFPAGLYNVYGRLSAGAGSSTLHLDKVTTGQGTSSQTTTNLGTFSLTGTSYNSFQWIPLKDSLGNLAKVNLAGQNTVRVTTGGGANANFYMLVPANTNLPAISGTYPDGRVLFQSTNKLVFTVSSPVTTISTNSVHVTLNALDVSSNLVFSGSSSSWNVSYTGLLPNQTYATVISVTDANGNSASSTLNIDTYNAVFVWEAEDFDFDPNNSPVVNPTGNRYIDNPVPTTSAAANSYFNQVGTQDIDQHTDGAHTGVTPSTYRPNDLTATTPITDAARQQFLDAGAPDYNVGFLGNFFWQNYTRTFPTGTFNVYAREARGDPGFVTNYLDRVTTGWGTTSQLTTRLGTFTFPGGGGWSAYNYTPLIDRFGNYANLVLGGTNTFRTTESIAVNINFYMLVPARTDLPRIDGVSPDGSLLDQRTNTFSFVASSPTYGIFTTNIHVTLNGVNISSNLVFTGSSSSWNVSFANVLPNTAYTAVITITDAHNQTTTTTVSFDTFRSDNFTWEAEDFDFDPSLSTVPNGTGNRYIDNPVPTDPASGAAANSYYNQRGALGIDEDSIFGTIRPAGGTYIWRPSDYVVNEVGTDTPRLRYLNAQQANVNPGIIDYDVAFWTNAAFINWTRTFPTGSFYAYARLAGGNGAFNLQCSQVTGGWGTMSQTAQYLGTFKGTGASFTVWQYVPLINTNTAQLVVLTLGGTNTFQMTADGNENANFFMLVPVPQPVTLSASLSGPNVILSFPTQTGFAYTVYYKNNVTDAAWTPLGGFVSGDGTIKTASDPAAGNTRFYRLTIQ